MRYIILLSFVLLSCSAEDKRATQGLPPVFDHLLGTWNFSESGLTETWTKESPTHYRGVVNYSFNGEKEASQYLDVKLEGDSVIYVGTKLGAAPDMLPIRFLMTESDSTHISFSNLTQEFPAKLEYTFISDKHFELNVNGTQNGEEMNRAFNYRR